MAVLRKEKREHFTVIDNAIFRDYNLSYKAKGLLCQMLSLPDGWNFSVSGLSALSTDGRDAITAALKELSDAGYFRREQKREDGKMAGVEYVISETKFAEKPFTENPKAEKPITENPHNKRLKDKGLTSSKTDDIYTEFENLWNLYPKKQGKDKAFGYYERARKSGTTYEEVGRGIQAYVEYIKANGIDVQYVKMGSTFFSQKSWGDDWSIRNSNVSKRRDINEVFAEIFEEHKYDV